MDRLVITFLWFFITVIALLLLLRLVFRGQYFDFRQQQQQQREEEEEMIQLEPESESCSEPGGFLWNQIEEEKDVSKFEFKFKYDNPQFEDFVKRMEEVSSSTRSEVKNHDHVLPDEEEEEEEEDSSFFLEQQQQQQQQSEASHLRESQGLNLETETYEMVKSNMDDVFESDPISISDGYSVKKSIIDSERNNFLDAAAAADDDDDDDQSSSNSSSEHPELLAENKTRIDDDEYDEDQSGSSSDLAGVNDSNETIRVLQKWSLNGISDSDMDELEFLWEHQDLIEQMSMELRKVMAIGLPIILEESQAPKSIQDPRNWKIDSMFLREDPMDELHKSYKSYRERMRKFDLLIHQKMYAIGFLQLKDPLQTFGSHKLLPLTAMFKCQRKMTDDDDPSQKLIKEYLSDLETVYVGQTCLSWEFLRWQHEKLQEISGSDHYQFTHQSFNQAVGEFQQLLVLIQRFLENEPFHGARVQNYAKSRCVLPNLLRVPVVREDETGEQHDNYDLTGEELENIIQKSMNVFWEFVKADRDEIPVILKSLSCTKIELENPIDEELMIKIHEDLHKKKKKLRDITRIGKWSLKKPRNKKQVEGGGERSIQDVFFAKVDMKLVSRVLKVSGITRDQLLWCKKKLNQITFEERRMIRRDPSFCLFPC